MEKTYKTLSPVDHDQKRFGVGEFFGLEDKDAAPLLAVKAIELAPVAQTAAAGAGSAVAPTDNAERIAAIVTAIGKLNVDSPELWTGGGMPKTDALSVITGWPVAAKDRDAAFAQFKAAQE